jgi:hypothetical protein
VSLDADLLDACLGPSAHDCMVRESFTNLGVYLQVATLNRLSIGSSVLT